MNVKDRNGKENRENYFITGSRKAKNRVIGNLTFVTTAKDLGINTVAPAKPVKIYANDTLADVAKRYFRLLPDVRIT